MDWIQTHIPPWVFICLGTFVVSLGTIAYLILLERKTASWVQDRLGPNRVGLLGVIPFLPEKLRAMKMFGLGQPTADGLKFLFKEDYRPTGVDKVLFTVAPMLMMVVVIISTAVLPLGGTRVVGTATFDATDIARANDGNPAAAREEELAAVRRAVPWPYHLIGTPTAALSDDGNRSIITYEYGYNFQTATLNIGVLYILAVLSLAVYGVVIGGWASNNKYSFLGGLRATANMISYEIPLGLAVLSIVILYGTLQLNEIVALQAHDWIGFIPAWNVFTQPLSFLLFLICIHAEANRAPFDIAEAEQELVGGYHTEYSSMRFALFFLGEYAGMITTSAVCVALFFGGWDFPGLRGPAGDPALSHYLIINLLRCGVFFVKTLVIIFIFMWTRWSLPRFRFDQIMQLAWRGLIPISIGQVGVTALVVYGFGQRRFDMRVNGWMAVALAAGNGAVLAITMLASVIVPAAPDTNRRVAVANSRFNRTPLPGRAVGVAPLNRGEVEQVPVDSMAAVAGRMGI